MAALDQLGHLPVEEGKQQGADVRTVHVRVGHDDDAVIAQLVGVVLILADAGAQHGDQGGDFLRGDELFKTGFFHVQNLALERQDRLELAISSLLGRASRRVAFDQIKLGQGGIFFLTIGQLARQAHAVQHALAARQVTRFARRFAGTGGINDLVDDYFRITGFFQQERAHLLGDQVLDNRAYF